MKGNLVRIFAIMTLASSISAFAKSDEAAKKSKTNSKNTNCEATALAVKADQNKADQNLTDEEKARKRLIEEQEKQWIHDLENTGGG